jgi:hypothetical protein
VLRVEHGLNRLVTAREMHDQIAPAARDVLSETWSSFTMYWRRDCQVRPSPSIHSQVLFLQSRML